MLIHAVERNAVRVDGDGKLLALVHGFGCDQTMWQEFRGQLAGCQVIRHDLTGMGASDYHAYDTARHGTLQGHVDDFIEVLEASGDDPVVAVGHSVSAIIVAMAANQRPELFCALVLICPNPFYMKDDGYDGGFSQEAIDGLLAAMEENYTGWSGQLASMVGGDARTSEVLEQRFCRNDPSISQHFARVTFLSDHRADVQKIQLPTLVIEASDDAIAPASVGQYLRGALPDAHFATIKCHGHAPHMSHPKQTAAALQSFLDQLA